MIAVGNEGAGLDPDIVKASSVKFSIPLAEGVESLNVAATAAVLSILLQRIATRFSSPIGDAAMFG